MKQSGITVLFHLFCIDWPLATEIQCDQNPWGKKG